MCIRQPPSGGCVLKQHCEHVNAMLLRQPPSGGCVLKRLSIDIAKVTITAATFGWLCVETKLALL